MAWTFKIDAPGRDPVELSEQDMSAGEWAAIFELVAKSVLHDENAIHPLHCPICRNAVAVTCLITRAGLDAGLASKFVAEASREEILACVSVTED